MPNSLRVLPLFLCFFAWMSSSDVSAQISQESIDAAQRYSTARGGIGLIVEQGGRIRYERYAKGHDGKKAIHIYSGTKSFFGVLAVMAEEDGILSLDEKVADTIKEWKTDRRKSQITIRELLNFTSGMVTGFEEIYGASTADKLTLAVGLPVKAERGDTFIYGPANLQVFCEVLRRKLNRKGISYRAYLDKKLIRPLGVDIPTWRADSHGNVIPSAGMWMSGRDWVKFGEMICHYGEANGRRLVSAEELTKCFRSTEINPAFGLCFWTNAYSSQPDAREVDVEEFLEVSPLPEDWRRVCLSRKAPQDLVCSIGSNFQRLYVVPSMALVIVHQGRKGARGFRDAEFLSILFGQNSQKPALLVEKSPETTTNSRSGEHSASANKTRGKVLFPNGFSLFRKRSGN